MIIKDFFVNITILIALLFLYCQWAKDRPLNAAAPFSTKVVAGVSGGFLGNILMLYSIHVTDEIRADLRYIPLLIAMVYGGWLPGFICTALIAGGRFLYGVNEASNMAAIIIIVTYLGFLIFCRKKWAFTAKVAAMLLYANMMFSLIFLVIVQDKQIIGIILPVYWVMCIAGGWLAVYLCEHFRKAHSLFKRYERESYTDFLTKLGNVRYFKQVFNERVQQAAEKGEELSLIYLDIDFFKKVNDTYGHQEGDRVLREMGRVLLQSTRSYDIVCRNGGEEFSVILPDCTLPKAVEVAERVRKAVELHPFTLSTGEAICVTVSLGVAHYPTIREKPLLKKADEALYLAKQNGRNQVRFT
ncbi:diguanylate cyclase [Fictibacillus sp. B-59209]|uniref:GGDEF domain-containing protein n=1 Tax=Fictibacillus sp. B-59209 TaxID=3024873 RepID=UPI002E24321D|nr:diguanylate cyclase [Fictibacillus sp. B-59209]